MMYQDLKLIVKDKFKNHKDRYTHTLGVVEMGEKLAIKYNLNVEDIKIACLLHDYTKYDTKEFHKENMSNNDYIKYKDEPFIYHAISASNLLETKFNINNNNIKDAIRYHVYGHKYMTLFSKVVLMSDKIEKNRNYPLVDKLRKLSFEDIDLALILFLEDNIRYNKTKGFNISKELTDTLNNLKKEYYEKTGTNQ